MTVGTDTRTDDTTGAVGDVLFHVDRRNLVRVDILRAI
jgi:hypothetical protein